MKTSYTPGPWDVRPVPSGKVIVISEAGKMYSHAYITTATNKPGALTGREYGNAALVGASPDLLRAAILALQLIKTHWPIEHGSQQVGETWGALEHSINKAKGIES